MKKSTFLTMFLLLLNFALWGVVNGRPNRSEREGDPDPRSGREGNEGAVQGLPNLIKS